MAGQRPGIGRCRRRSPTRLGSSRVSQNLVRKCCRRSAISAFAKMAAPSASRAAARRRSIGSTHSSPVALRTTGGKCQTRWRVPGLARACRLIWRGARFPCVRLPRRRGPASVISKRRRIRRRKNCAPRWSLSRAACTGIATSSRIWRPRRRSNSSSFTRPCAGSGQGLPMRRCFPHGPMAKPAIRFSMRACAV